MKFKRVRVNGGNSHDSLKVASSECHSNGNSREPDEIIDTLKKLKDADPADSHHASLDAEKEQDMVKQDIVTVTILTNFRQGEAVVKEEVVSLTATIVTNFRRGSRWRWRVRPGIPSFSCPTPSSPRRGRCCSAEARLQHECKFLCECVDMCLSGNPP